MTYEKVSPSEYTVQITNASSPFVLVLGNLFAEGWQAWVANAQASQHFTVNLGMNAWVISKQGSFTIDVRFAEQSVVINSAIISGSTFVLLATIFLMVLVRRRAKKLD